MIRPFISRLGPPEKGFRDGRRPGSQRVVEVLFVTYSALVAILNAHAAQAVHPSAVKNRVPLRANAFYPLPLSSVKPAGWLRRQTLDLIGAGSVSSLPRVEPMVALGAAFVW